MCSRFELTATPDEIARRFGLPVAGNLPNSPELRPTDLALVITATGPHLMNWGLAVDWDTKPLINARAETLDQKKTFRSLLANRCLVPATAYFEWRKDGAAKYKNRIAPADGQPMEPLFAFAGLYEGERFTIITCPPTPSIAHIHNRMPVIVDGKAEAQWINSDMSFEAVSGTLIPYKADTLIAKEETPPPGPQPDLFD
jgi:putative SOS response-associated peptidase YedK